MNLSDLLAALSGGQNNNNEGVVYGGDSPDTLQGASLADLLKNLSQQNVSGRPNPAVNQPNDPNMVGSLGELLNQFSQGKPIDHTQFMQNFPKPATVEPKSYNDLFYQHLTDPTNRLEGHVGLGLRAQRARDAADTDQRSQMQNVLNSQNQNQMDSLKTALGLSEKGASNLFEQQKMQSDEDYKQGLLDYHNKTADQGKYSFSGLLDKENNPLMLNTKTGELESVDGSKIAGGKRGAASPMVRALSAAMSDKLGNALDIYTGTTKRDENNKLIRNTELAPLDPQTRAKIIADAGMLLQANPDNPALATPEDAIQQVIEQYGGLDKLQDQEKVLKKGIMPFGWSDTVEKYRAFPTLNKKVSDKQPEESIKTGGKINTGTKDIGNVGSMNPDYKGLPTINSKEEYDALPPGATFLNPFTGQPKVKP